MTVSRYIFLFAASLLAVNSLAAERHCKRVVSLSPAVTEMICAIGAEQMLVGRSRLCDHPAETVKNIPVAGGLGTPDVEKIITLQADIVICDIFPPGAAWNKLEKAGIKVCRLESGTLSIYRNNVMTVGRMLGKEREAASEVKRFFDRLSECRKNTPASKISVLILLGINPLVSCNKYTFTDEVATLAGLHNIARETDQKYFVISKEYVVVRDPQIVLAAGIPGNVRTVLRETSAWKNLQFMKNNAIIDTISPELLCRLSPRTPDAVMLLQKEIEKMIRREGGAR